MEDGLVEVTCDIKPVVFTEGVEDIENRNEFNKGDGPFGKER